MGAPEDALGTHLDAELAAWMRERIARLMDAGDAGWGPGECVGNMRSLWAAGVGAGDRQVG